jgi:hypothetical protein
MALAQRFHITIENRTGTEVKATKFEYMKGNRSATENIFGVDGSDTIPAGGERGYTRNLQGIEGQSTRFTVTYQPRKGDKWGANETEETGSFTCQDDGSKTVTLTES